MSEPVSILLAAANRLLAAFHGIDLSDDRGVEDSPSKMIWIAVTIGIAVLGTAFALIIFNQARDSVPDVPAPPAGAP